MKKFNGTDYDGLLPLAYNALNSQQLDGKTFNQIQNLFDSEITKRPLIATGTYIGTGTYGQNSPTIINCGFKPKLIFISVDQNTKDLFNFVDRNYVSINGSQYVYNTIDLMVNTFAPELRPDNRRGARAAYLCLKVDEGENKFLLGTTDAGYDTSTHVILILTYYSTDSGISLYCDQYAYLHYQGTEPAKNFRNGATQLNEQGTTYHYVIFG